MLDKLREIIKAKSFAAAWEYCKDRNGPCGKAKWFGALQEVCHRKEGQTHGDERDKWRKRKEDASRERQEFAKRCEELKDDDGVNWNGHPSNVTDAVKGAAKRANQAGLYVTATTDGIHAPTSWHPSGNAVDVAGPVSAMISFQRAEAKRGYGKYRELFGPDSFYIKNGARFNSAFPDHGDHVHVAPTS